MPGGEGGCSPRCPSARLCMFDRNLAVPTVSQRLSISGRSFLSARAHSRRTAPGLRPIARATSSQSRPSSVRSTTTSRWSAASSARASARMILDLAPLGRLAGRMPVGRDQVAAWHATWRRRGRPTTARAGPTRTSRLEPANQVGQVPRQDPPQPGDQLGLGLALELVEVLVGFQQRFLDQVGRVGLAAQRGVDAGAGQEPQVVAIRLQQPVQRARRLAPRLLNQPIDDRPPSTMGGPSSDQSLSARPLDTSFP